MKIRPLHLALLATGALALAACRNDSPNPDERSPGASGATASTAAPADGSAAQTLPGEGPGMGTAPDATADAQGVATAGAERGALGVLNAINDHEIAAGRQALDKGVQGPVADYARTMIEEHSRNREKTLAMNPDSEAADARAQRRKGEQQLQALAGRQGEEYSRAYVQAMVQGHEEALAALDGKLIPAATTSEAVTHLRKSREHVAMHLQQARALPGAGTDAATADAETLDDDAARTDRK